MARKRRTFSEEFKAEAVRIVRESGKTVAQGRSRSGAGRSRSGAERGGAGRRRGWGAMRWLRRLILVLYGLGLAPACGGCAPRSLQARRVDFAGPPMTLNVNRTAAVFATEEALVLLRGETAHRLDYARHSCLRDAHKKADTLLLSPDGWRVIVHGTRSNTAGDWFGHAGRHVSIACMADFERGTVQALEGVVPGSFHSSGRYHHHWGSSGRYLYQWEVRGSGLTLDVLDLEGRRSLELSEHALALVPPRKDRVHVCALREVPEQLLLACATYRYPAGATVEQAHDQELIVQRFDLGQWPLRLSGESRFPLPALGEPIEVRLSRGGQLLTYLGRSGSISAKYQYGVLDLRSGEPAFVRTGVTHRGVAFIAPTEQEDGVLVGETDTDGFRLSRLRLDGTPVRSEVLDGNWLRHLEPYAMPGSESVWLVGSGRAVRPW